MPLTRRYSPSHSSGDDVAYGMDFSTILPPGIGIKDDGSAALDIFYNRAPAPGTGYPPAATDLIHGPVHVRGAMVWAAVSVADAAHADLGNDYLLRWAIFDTRGNRWERTALLLVALTS